MKRLIILSAVVAVVSVSAAVAVALAVAGRGGDGSPAAQADLPPSQASTPPESKAAPEAKTKAKAKKKAAPASAPEPATEPAEEAPIVVSRPAAGTRVGNPLTVAGTANTFEAWVGVKVLDARGKQVAWTYTTATCGTGCRGTFSVRLSYDVTHEQEGLIVVFDDDPDGDGEPFYKVRIPVVLTPGVPAIWPVSSRLELARAEAGYAAGHQSWLGDPAAVARGYLGDALGLDPVMGAYRAKDDLTGSVPYRAGSVRGTVHVRRLEGGSVWFVTSARSGRIGLAVSPLQSTIVVTVRSRPAGLVVVRAVTSRGDTVSTRARLGAGETGTLSLDLGSRPAAPVFVEVRHRDEAGATAVGAFRVDRGFATVRML